MKTTCKHQFHDVRHVTDLVSGAPMVAQKCALCGFQRIRSIRKKRPTVDSKKTGGNPGWERLHHFYLIVALGGSGIALLRFVHVHVPGIILFFHQIIGVLIKVAAGGIVLTHHLA